MSLAEIALSQPHATYAACLSSQWAYLLRIPDIEGLLHPLENAIPHPSIDWTTIRDLLYLLSLLD